MNFVKTFFIVVMTLALTRCGSSDSASSTTTSALMTTMGMMAITSPSAADSSVSASFWKKQTHIMTAMMKLSLLAPVLKWFGVNLENTSHAAESTEAPDGLKPYKDMVADLETIVSVSSAQAIANDIGSLVQTTKYRAPCYGPSWTDTATGGPVSRLTGDLGFVAETASDTDSTACAGAQLNALVASSPQFANKFLKLQGAMIAAAGENRKALPETEGEIQDNLAIMPTFSGITFTTAALTKLANREDEKSVYKTHFAFNVGAQEGTALIYHTPLNDDNSDFEGYLRVVLPQTTTANVAGFMGLVWVYKQEGSLFTYSLDTASNRNSADTDFFNSSTGRLDYTKAAFGEDGNRVIASFNTTTNETIMHYAWQAGSGDGAVRAFHMYIPTGTADSLTGYAYFGFGPSITTLTDNTTTLWATKMHCNWMDGGASGLNLSLIQKQTLLQSGGIFTEATSNIAFAPNNNCQGSDFTVTSSVPTLYNGVRSVSSNNLVAPPTSGAAYVPVVTVPTYILPE